MGVPSTERGDTDPDVPAQAPSPADSRRALLGKAALGASAGAAILAGWPALAALFSRGTDPGPGELPFLPVAREGQIGDQPARFPLAAPMRDGWLTVMRDLGAVWIFRTPGGLTALSASCPHLGCGVERAPNGYFCPCHESQFDASGARLSGPSPRGLDRLAVRVENGQVLVRPLPMGMQPA